MPSRRSVIGVVAILLGLPGVCGAQDFEARCATCHRQQEAELVASVHQTLQCRECHGGQATYPMSRERAEEFTRRRGKPGLSFAHGPSFAGKPVRAGIPALCGGCHADVERMNPYGLRTDQLAQYKSSGHGKTLFGRGDDRVAVCTDCHASGHRVLAASNPHSRTHPLSVVAMCASCHSDASLMGEYGLPTEVVSEYRRSVHGRLVLEQKDTGAPTCATCHGNHSAAPPGFASVGAVCGRCHEKDAKYFAAGVHATQPELKGCVQCHGGGEGRHFHLIEAVTRPTGMMVRRYERLLASEPQPTVEQISRAIHPEPRGIINQSLSSCLECHDEVEEDESLAKQFVLLERIAEAEGVYVKTAARLEEVGRGVLLVDNQRFKLEDARTHLVELPPLQHTLDEAQVSEKIAELTAICDEVNAELDDLVGGLRLRYRMLVPVWVFAIWFSILCYWKYKKVKAEYVAVPGEARARPSVAEPAAAVAGVSRRGFLDWLIGLGTAVAGAAMAIPGLFYLWPAARGGKTASVEVPDAAGMEAGDSAMVQVAGKVVIVVRGRSRYRAFSAICTHLGCLVKWDRAGRQFLCPCHAAVFDEEGQVVSGPPPAPLPEYVVKEVGDQVLVSAT